METLVLNILIWALGPFAVASILMVVFTTKFVQHVFEILKWFRYRRKTPEYYEFHDPVLDYTENVGNLTKSDMDKWLLQGPFHKDHPRLAELLTCPGCMAMQCSLWLGLVTSLCVGNLWLWPIAFLTWPSAGRILFKKI